MNVRIVVKPMGTVLLVSLIAVLTAVAISRSTPSHAEKTAVVSDSRGALPGVVYDSQFMNGWQSWGWAHDIVWQDRTVTRQAGSGASISTRLGKFEAVYLRNDTMDCSGFDRVSLCLNGGPQGGQHLRVSLLVNAEAKDGTTHVVDYPLDPLPASKWTRITLGLANLHLSGKRHLNGIWVMNPESAKTDRIYIDDVRLLKPQALE